MSEVQASLNQKYTDLCITLGGLSYKRAVAEYELANLEQQIADLESQIKALNTLAPTMRKFELELINKTTAKDVAPGTDGKETCPQASLKA